MRMPNVIFARPRHVYGSYTDYWRLVELSGYPIIHIDEIDAQSDHTYIFSTPATHWHDGVERQGWPEAKARIIYQSLEWYTDVDYRNVPGLAEVWSGDAYYAAKIGARYVPIGSHPDLCPGGLTDERPEYDVATLWSPCYRRYFAIGQFQTHAISVAPQGWGEERHRALSHARAMVQVHQLDDMETVAPQRWCLAAAYGLPMITETLADCGIFTPGYRLMCDLQHLASFITTWVSPENANLLKDYGRALHRMLCQDYTFKMSIEANV